MTTETKPIETKHKQTNQNGTKPDKVNALNYEIPMSPDEA
jgi:hypothetical protein